MMKDAFEFILKAPFFLEIFKFAMTFWLCGKNDWIRKIRLNSRRLTSPPGQQTITIHILLNISRSKLCRK